MRQGMESSLCRAYLQRFWAAGYDLNKGMCQGWLNSLTLEEMAPNELWFHLSHLPTRRGWSFEEPVDPKNLIHLMDRKTHIADYGQIIRDVLYGAELGIRTCLRWLKWLPDGRSTRSHGSLMALVWSSWERELNLPQPSPQYRLDQLDLLIHRYGLEVLTYNPYQESTTILPKAFLQGLLWPLWFERARGALAKFRPYYSGASWPAAWWMADVASKLSCDDRSLEAYYSAFTDLPKASQVRSIGTMTWTSYKKGQPYEVWWRQLCRQMHYYPSDHVVPNLAIIFAALCWGSWQWNSVLNYICRSGFDIVGNAMLAGALCYVHHPEPSVDCLDVESLEALRRLREIIEAQTYLIHRP